MALTLPEAIPEFARELPFDGPTTSAFGPLSIQVRVGKGVVPGATLFPITAF